MNEVVLVHKLQSADRVRQCSQQRKDTTTHYTGAHHILQSVEPVSVDRPVRHYLFYKLQLLRSLFRTYAFVFYCLRAADQCALQRNYLR